MDAHHVFLAYSKKVTKIFQNLFKNVCTNVSRINIFFRKHQFFSTLAGIDLKFCPPWKIFQLPYWNCSLSVFLYQFKQSLFPNMFSFFKNSRHWARKNRPSFKTFPAGLSKLFSTCPEDQSGKKIVPFCFLSFPDIARNLCGLCSKFFSADLSKKNSICPRKPYKFLQKKNILSNKNTFVISYWNIEQIISGFLAKNFLQVCKNSILPLHTKSSGNFFSDTFTALHRSWTLSEYFPAIFGFF